MVEKSRISPEIGEVRRSPEGFTSEPLPPEPNAPARQPVSHSGGPFTAPHTPAQPQRVPEVPVQAPGLQSAPPERPMPQAAIPDETPAMPKKRKPSGSMLKWLILVAVGLLAVSIGSLFWSSPSFSDRDVVLTLESPDRATSGEEVTYILKWQNNTKLELKDLSFRIFYPEDSVVIVDGEPTQPDSEGFTVESLKPGESGEREIVLFLVGEKGSIKNATVNLIFKAGTLRSAFEKEVQVNTTITDLPVTLTLTAPPTTVSGQPVTYILDARNEKDEDLTDLRLEIGYPEGFSIRDINPSTDGGSTNTWTIDELPQGEGIRFTIQGTLSGVQREAKTITAVLKRKVGDEYIDFVKTDSVTLLSSPLLSVSTTVNGSRDHTAFLGEKLRYRINYSNNSNQNLIGLNLEVRLDGTMYDFADAEIRDGFLDQAVNTVRFSASGVPDLASLPPGKSGSVEFTIPVKTSFASGGTGSFFVKASTRLSTSNVPTGVEGSEVFAQDVLTTKISSQPSLSQTITVAGGSVPMTVGEKTNFTVAWSIINPGNELRDASVTVTLPPGIIWDGVEFGGGATFDPNTQRVTWNIGTVPFGTGAGLSALSANFQMSTTPSDSQRGTIMKLLGNAVLNGKDSFTGQVVQSVTAEATAASVEGLGSDARVK